MLRKLKQYFIKKAYSEKTNYLLNNFTLKITDKTIEQKVQRRFYERFNDIYWYCTAASLVTLAYHAFMYLTGRGPFFALCIIVVNFILQIAIGFVRAFKPTLTPLMTFPYLLTHVVFTCLFYFGKVGEWHDRPAFTQQIVLNFVLVNSVQFNDIFFTLFAQIPLFMIGIYV